VQNKCHIYHDLWVINVILCTNGVGFYLYGRFHDVPLGIFVETIAKLRLLPKVYQMVKPGKGRFQVGRLQSGVQALGRA